MYWVWIVDNNYGTQETASQEGHKHRDGRGDNDKNVIFLMDVISKSAAQREGRCIVVY